MQLFNSIQLCFVLLVVSACSSGTNVSWDQLIHGLGIEDGPSLHVVREAYQQYSESTAIGRAQLACALAHRFLNIKSFFAPSSPLYTNRTRVNW